LFIYLRINGPFNYESIFSNTSYDVVQEGWKLEKNEQNISVYTRSVTGSKFKEFKAVTIVKTSLPSLVALLKDLPSQTLWIDQCIMAKSLKKVNETEDYIYYVSHAPWPVSDRDMITHSLITQDSVTKIVKIQMNGIPAFIPKKENLVRVPFLKGNWELIPREKDLVEIIYQLHADPGGSIPGWLANYTVVDNPFKTMLNMKEYVQKDMYQHTKYSFIKEKIVK
jgi:hypothetical protein